MSNQKKEEIYEMALDLDRKAKKENQNFERKVILFQKAAEKYKEINDEKNSKWCLGNSYSVKATIHLNKREFKNAIKVYYDAEIIFLELDLMKPAFYCASKRLYSYIVEDKTNQTILTKEEYFTDAERYFNIYKIFSENEWFLSNRIDYYKRKSKISRIEGELEKAEEFSIKCYELAEKGYKKYRKEYFKIAKTINKQMYFNIKAKRFANEREFENAALCYKESGDLLKEFDEKRAYGDYVNYHKFLAITNKYDKNKLERNLRKAIEFANKIGDEKQINYLLGLKYDHLHRFAKNIDERIELMTKAKEHYYKAEDKSSGILFELFMLYNMSQKELINGNYEKAIKLLNKVEILIPKVKFPNIFYSPKIFEAERFLYFFYNFFSNRNFPDAANSLSQYLKLNEENRDTSKFKYYELVKEGCDFLSKNRFSYSDVRLADKMLQNSKITGINPLTYQFCSLVYSYVIMSFNGIQGKDVLEKIQIKIMNKITTDEVSKDLERKIEVQKAIEELDWFVRLPTIFIESFDQSLYLLYNVLEDFKYTSFKEFYKILEKYIEMIVEFNSKVIWNDKWQFNLEKTISDEKKSFKYFSFGEMVKSLRLLKEEQICHCKNLKEETLRLLEKHVEIRNIIIHDLIMEIPEFNIVEDISRIMYELLCTFPLCIEIINIQKKPWYDIKILWSQIPKKVSLFTELELKKGKYYYLNPTIEIIDNKLKPKFITDISEETIRTILNARNRKGK